MTLPSIFTVHFFFLFVFLFSHAHSSVIRPLARSSPDRLDNFRRAHSLGDSYKFDSRDGWTTINATNLRAPRNSPAVLESRSKKASDKGEASTSAKSSVLKVLSKIINGVTITWYTGHDLLNPSCWAQSVWAPTDESFVCALTMDGWQDKPKCFQFLQICNGPKKCVYVRVVDTCAGCAAGSQHVDLTKAAFSKLADLGTGTMSVSMRIVEDPLNSLWDVALWGPRIS
ncbi:hypothetical protein D9757_000117 [Collybiopsis confluens]|uniref:RlpA-like protein double-psi beta-barrel domain-containing protein n=1 Tax=Collybiopsis confluens TaxID=2823264 RepID=A0A8H5I283_9AGAR|nr:hypothetical protein D9757_000117 [Collybiopsis confluens]